MTTELSDYEKERLANIARNQKVLESLGLVRRDAELHESIRSKEAPKKKRKIDPESAEAVRAAVRRSARLAGAPASSQGLLSPSAGDSSTAGESSSADHSEAQVSEPFLNQTKPLSARWRQALLLQCRRTMNAGVASKPAPPSWARRRTHTPS